MRFQPHRTLPLFSRVLVLLLVASAFSFAAPDDNSRATTADKQKAADLFQKACITCHLPPDPNLATDRARLNQIKDTA